MQPPPTKNDSVTLTFSPIPFSLLLHSCRHIVKNNLFAPVVDAFIRNNGRYNLLESAILELFEFIKVEDVKSLCTYVVENFSKIFDEIEYVQTFKHLKARYEQHQEMLKERDKILDRSV